MGWFPRPNEVSSQLSALVFSRISTEFTQSLVSISLYLSYLSCLSYEKNHRTDGIHSISNNKLYLWFLLYSAFVREVSIKFYLCYEFFSYDRHDRYNDMETRLKIYHLLQNRP